ncbi:3-oxoacyl-ACP synthase [Fusibacter sp. JL216-2]|uniref:3-oxoacyl-ACP synthase n=1 Tax=Fusibacter sp. JL216-2 TaxID=3071453 RepID=UPI003D347B2D
MNQTTCGIVGYGLYIPEGRMSAHELSKVSGLTEDVIIEKIGIREKVLGGKDDHCVAMAIKSAKKCLEQTGFDPMDIDLIIFNGEEYKEYICWTAAIKVQKEIGALNAWGFDISYRCSSTVLGIKVAKDMMASNNDIKNVLICGANTIGYLVDPTDPNSTFMLPLTVGACSVLLQKGHNKNQVLETFIKTEPVFADDVVASHNGTNDPRHPKKNGSENLWTLKMPDYQTFKDNLKLKTVPAFLDVASRAMKSSGVQSKDIDYVSMVHIKRSAHNYILSELGFSQDQSIYLDEYGHVGHVDNILSLDLALKAGKIKNGSCVMMLTGGLGYSFASLIIKWG